jgi:DNA repair exonuclease SbcCD ATPase subunit
MPLNLSFVEGLFYPAKWRNIKKGEPQMESSEEGPTEVGNTEVGNTEDESIEAETIEAVTTEEETAEVEKQKEGPSIIQRILLYAAMAISVIFLLLGLAGIIGVWAINTPATETVLAVLEPIDLALQRMELASQRAGGALSETSAALENADQRVQELGETVAETSLIREAVSRIVEEDVQTRMSETRENIRALYDTLAAVEEAIQAFNAIPFVGLELPGSEEIAAVRTSMEEIAIGVAELSDEVQQRREERAENLVERLSRPINRLNTRVEEMLSKIADTEARLGLAIERIDNIQNQVPLWIDIISVVDTLLLAWFMFSQGAVFVLCRQALKS